MCFTQSGMDTVQEVLGLVGTLMHHCYYLLSDGEHLIDDCLEKKREHY